MPPVWILAAAGGGGGALVLLLIVGCCLVRRKRRLRKPGRADDLELAVVPVTELEPDARASRLLVSRADRDVRLGG